MAKINFTAGRIASFNCASGKQQSIYWDAKTPGLGLRVTSSGTKSYIFETRINKQTIRLTIGGVKTWTIETAQRKATEYKAMTDQNIDPRQVLAAQILTTKEMQKEALRKNVTFSDAWYDYIEVNKSGWGARYLKEHYAYVKVGGAKKLRGKGLTVDAPLAAFLNLPLTAITKDKVTSWLEKEGATRPTSAALSYRMLRAFIRWTQESDVYSGLINEDSYKAKSVRRSLRRGKAKNDCLQREQLSVWFKAVNSLTNPYTKIYLQGLLITGARKEELATLKWSDIDFQWKTLSIRDKVEGVRVIPLTPYFANQLLTLKSLNQTPPNVRQIREKKINMLTWTPSPWVFASATSKTGRLTEPRPAHVQVLEEGGLPHITLHGLRRSFKTLSEWVEMPSGISAQIMGHKPSAIAEKHYIKRSIDLLRKWHTSFEKWILDEAGIVFEEQKGLKVVSSNKVT